MCGCEPSFVCSRCAGTTRDPYYEADAPLTVAEEQERWLVGAQFQGDWKPTATP